MFAEPWQAQAFALAVQLSAAGHFTWTEWTTALGDQLQAAADRGEPDDGSRYFEHWLAALEQLVAEKQLTDLTALRERKDAWADAYRHTPHGPPTVPRGPEPPPPTRNNRTVPRPPPTPTERERPPRRPRARRTTEKGAPHPYPKN